MASNIQDLEERARNLYAKGLDPTTLSKLQEIDDPLDRLYCTLSVLLQSPESQIADDIKGPLQQTVSDSYEKAIKEKESLEKKTITDKLTGLFNRLHLDNTVCNELSSAYRDGKKKFSVLLFDIDFFKKFNDTYGHTAGDTVLISLGEIVDGITRQHDIPCRYGGEEFVVVLPETDLDGAIKYGYHLNKEIGNTNITFTDEDGNEQSKSINISTGVTEIDQDDPVWLLYGKAGRDMIRNYIGSGSDIEGVDAADIMEQYLSIFKRKEEDGDHPRSRRKKPTKKLLKEQLQDVGDFVRKWLVEKKKDNTSVHESNQQIAFDYIIKRADNLLYFVKKSGRNNIGYRKKETNENVLYRKD